LDRGARSEQRTEEPDPIWAPCSGTRARFASPVVLVVDDTEDNRDLYAMILGRLGYEVVVAVDGVDGVARARASRPSVILMDLAMPKLDGFDATRQIRATPEIANVHIIAVSAFTDALNVQRALAAGCNEVLAKPCPPAVLAGRVEKAVRAHVRSVDGA
jgi:CheY-like chemotaxis protein